jgi:hypothetical protein
MCIKSSPGRIVIMQELGTLNGTTVLFCPECDRRRCGQCKTPVMDPKADHCTCGHKLLM